LAKVSQEHGDVKEINRRLTGELGEIYGLGGIEFSVTIGKI